jgi:hypothetical protein
MLCRTAALGAAAALGMLVDGTGATELQPVNPATIENSAAAAVTRIGFKLLLRLSLFLAGKRQSPSPGS